MKTKSLFLSLLLLSSVPIGSMAQSASLSGQYGCMLNKNWGGYIPLQTGANNTLTNELFYLDFTANSFQRSTVGIMNFNTTSTSVSYGQTLNGTLTISSGPIINTYTISGVGSLGATFQYTGMLVNNSNTILLSVSGSNGVPGTGVCQKI